MFCINYVKFTIMCFIITYVNYIGFQVHGTLYVILSDSRWVDCLYGSEQVAIIFVAILLHYIIVLRFL